MAIPPILRDRLSDPQLWEAFFYEVEDSETVPDVVVEFEVGDGCHVILDMAGGLDAYDLGIRFPGAAEVASLGWDDLAHWHPYALRWDELELICRAVAVCHPELSHPGTPLVLLCRFAGIHDGDEVDRILPVMREAFESLRPAGWTGYWPDAEDWLGRRDFRDQGVTWTRDSDGYLYADQDDDPEVDFYSTRVEPTGDESDFPYDGLRAVLTAARRTVGG